MAGPVLVERLLRVANQDQGYATLLAPSLLLLAAAAMQAVAAAANGWLLGSISVDVVRDLRRKLYERLQQMPVAWFDRTPTGAIMTRLMDDVAVVQALASGQALTTLLDVLTALAAATWIVSCGWRLACLLAAIVGFYLLIFRTYVRRIHAGALEVRRQLDHVFAQLKQKIDGMHVVRANSGEAAEVAEFSQQLRALHQPRLQVNRLGVAFSSLSTAVGGIGAACVFAVGTNEVLAGRLTIGELIAASALAGLLFAPVTRLSELASTYQQAAASFARLSEILDCPLATPTAKANAESAAPAALGGIEFEDVQFRYEADRPVLEDVSLRIEPGTRLAVVGPTGSGKTTLTNLLLRFYEPTAGRILLDGQALADAPLADLRRQIGIVPQEPVVFRRTLAENICYGTPGAGPAEIEAAARAALVHDLAMRLPDGYDTLVGEGGHPLSQGERQRITLARLFCKNPSVVVLDEATSSLDPACESLVQQALDRLLSGRTTLVIAHRLATVLGADRIIVMDQGRIVQSGSHAELLAQQTGLYRRLYDCQFGSPAPPPSEVVQPLPSAESPALPAAALELGLVSG
jgi:ABC-type multidrug transport system fused ATPase/permease subunit